MKYTERVAIDLYNAHLWDVSTITAVVAITAKYAKYGKTVEIESLHAASLKMRERLGGELGVGHQLHAVGLKKGAPGSLVGNVKVDPI